MKVSSLSRLSVDFLMPMGNDLNNNDEWRMERKARAFTFFLVKSLESLLINVISRLYRVINFAFGSDIEK